MVPYVDVMLVLLVIFMVAAPMMRPGIDVDLPEATSGPLDIDENEPTLVVSVKSDQTYYINTGESEEPVALDVIRERAEKILGANPEIKVLVEGDRSLPYGVIINLMSVLESAGANHVGLITEPPANG